MHEYRRRSAPRLAALGLAALVLCMPMLASGGEALTLAQAQEEARAKAPEGALFSARLKAAEELAIDARRAVRRDPSINFNVAPGELGGDTSERDIGVGLRWSVDVTGSWVPRRASAAADRDRSKYDREDALRALDEAVATAHAEVGFLQRQVTRADRLRELYSLGAEAARRQLSAGTGNQIDLDAADLDLIQSEAIAQQLGGELRRGQIRLARLLGRPARSELWVDDPEAMPELPPTVQAEEMAARDPRVRARQAEHQAAQKERDTFRRLIWAGPTLGVDYGYRRRSIGVGAFRGPAASGLSASWTDQEITFSIAAPIPIADRQTAGRARVRGRIALAEAQVLVTRADVATEVAAADADLRTAIDVLQTLAPSREILERELHLVELAVKAGTLDVVARAATLRRLMEVGRRLDEAMRAYRVARARWTRQTAVPR